MRSLYKNIFAVLGTILFLVFIFVASIIISENKSISFEKTYAIAKESDFIYLTDIDYLKEQSNVGWGKITFDKNSDGGLLSLIVDGKRTYFIKGLFAHAPSTIVYELNGYNYDYFTAYVGIDSSRNNNGNGIKFNIYTSNNGKDWNLQKSTDTLMPNQESEFIKVAINDSKYLKLEIDSLGSNTNDHAIYANAKLIKKDYEEDSRPVNLFKTVEEYDQELKKESFSEQINNQELMLLQRNFVNEIGYDVLQDYVKYSDLNKETIEWLFNDKEVLKRYTMGGEPIGNYISSLDVLTRLYHTYKDDLKDPKNGDMYLNMMISLSLTHSNDVCLWIKNNGDCSDAIRRYQIYKDLYNDKLLENDLFKSLKVEEMRWVMNNSIDDDEIKWLNDYARKYPVINENSDVVNFYNLDPYKYITYRQGYNYEKADYYDKNNYAKWNQKYQLEKYNIVYQEGYPKLFSVFEEGAVCGGISKIGVNLRQVFGIPATVISQPGHAAYLVYSKNDNGEGLWNIYNDVSGWSQSEKSERMLLGWGSTAWDSYYQVPYVLLAQDALNNFEDYEKAKELLLLADIYKDDYDKLEELYNEVIEVEPINIDAWYNLIKLYESNQHETDETYFELIKRITKSFSNHPLPMYDLISQIKPSIKTNEYKLKIDELLTKTLEDISKMDNSTYLQASASRSVANYLLGNDRFKLATFSFDGDDAGKIILSKEYQNDTNNTTYQYCLDGLNNSDPDNLECNGNWVQTSDGKHQLTVAELARISTDNGISIRILGSSVIYTIDIIKAEKPTNLYANDLENIITGTNSLMEWQLEDTNTWTKFDNNNSPIFSGDKTVYVRIGKNANYLESDSISLNFTTDQTCDTMKYISFERLKIVDVSSEEITQNNQAKNIIDGNINTLWHSYWNGSDNKKYITIKVDQPIYLSKIQYYPRTDSENGSILNAYLYVSNDNKNWELVASQTAWSNDSNVKEIILDAPVKAQYIKLVGEETIGNWVSAAMINLFEDVTIKEENKPPVENEENSEIVIPNQIEENNKDNIEDNVSENTQDDTNDKVEEPGEIVTPTEGDKANNQNQDIEKEEIKEENSVVEKEISTTKENSDTIKKDKKIEVNWDMAVLIIILTLAAAVIIW